MQSRNFNGVYGDVLKYNPNDLEELLSKKGTESVKIFKATNKQIKKHNKFRTGKRFQKVPRVKL